MARFIPTCTILLAFSLTTWKYCSGKQPYRRSATRQSQSSRDDRPDRPTTATSSMRSWIPAQGSRAKRPGAGHSTRLSRHYYDDDGDEDMEDDDTLDQLEEWSGSEDGEPELDDPDDASDDPLEDDPHMTWDDLELDDAEDVEDHWEEEDDYFEEEDGRQGSRGTVPRKHISGARSTWTSGAASSEEGYDGYDDDGDREGGTRLSGSRRSKAVHGYDDWDPDGGRSHKGGSRHRASRYSTVAGDPPSGRHGRRPSKRSRATVHGRPGALVRYSGRHNPQRGFTLQIPAVNTAALAQAFRRRVDEAREVVGQAGSLAATTTKKLQREVKLAVSGSWESALLKVTWPDDLTPDDDLVRSLVGAVKEFKRDTDVTKNSAEHRVLLRKLWTKMSDSDWRTVSKAVYLFHCILRELSTEQHAVLKVFLAKMSREFDKKTGRRYFDLEVLCDVTEDGEVFRSFVDRYGTYVFKRAEGFSARFQELDAIQSADGWEEAVTALAKAQKAIELGISCQPTPVEETELTIACLRGTALDVRQLWRRFHSALAFVLEEAEAGDLFEGVDPGVLGECLDDFKAFYTSRYNDVASFLADSEELMGIYGLRAPDLSIPPEHDFASLSSAGDLDGGETETERRARTDRGDGDDRGGPEDGDGDDDVEGSVESAGLQDEDCDEDTDGDDEDEEDEDEDEEEEDDEEDDGDDDDGGDDDDDDDYFEDGEDEDEEDEEDEDEGEERGKRDDINPGGNRRAIPLATPTGKSSPVRHASSVSAASGVSSRVPPSRNVSSPSLSSSAANVTGTPAAGDSATTSTSRGTHSRPSEETHDGQMDVLGEKGSGTPDSGGAGLEASTADGSCDTRVESQGARRNVGESSGATVASGLGRTSRDERREGRLTDLDGAGEAEEGGDEGEDDENGREDGEEEGEVDDVDDLTYFDDATQAEGTDGDWDRF